jgi:hypothetical protein
VLRLEPCIHKTQPDVRFSSKATELPRRSEMTRWATSALTHSLIIMWRLDTREANVNFAIDVMPFFRLP